MQLGNFSPLLEKSVYIPTCSLYYIKSWFQILGTGTVIGGKPVIDEEDGEYKLSLSESELASLLDDEDFKAQQAIDKEREEDEKAVSI